MTTTDRPFIYTATLHKDDGTTLKRTGESLAESLPVAALRAQLDEAMLWSQLGQHGEVRITEIREAQ